MAQSGHVPENQPRAEPAALGLYYGHAMKFEDYKIILYRQEDGSSWVAEIPALPACYALMKTREEALAELSNVFSMVQDEYREKGQELPADTTEIVNA